MINAKGRLAEAYTCVSTCASKITDTGFSYTARGETSDVYESTPHSGGYYHVSQSYWANRALDQLSGLSGLPTITYNVDGEGRVYSASASSGQNPLSSTAYNVASEPLQVNLGSADSDTFTYYQNTDQMETYEFNVNGQSVVGTFTWNSIGTLETLAITDPFNTANAQTCSYAHDDLIRIASVNCGSVWSQTFTYDAFGNLSKSGTQSFQPTYSPATNHMTQIGSSTPTYDGNGNVTNDFLHTYAWDAAGRPVTIDGVGATYDAIGRMVEQNRSGTYTEIVYAPSGAKLALMSGQSLTEAFVPLSGGSTAVYNSSGLVYYRHSDHLGSSRFASTPTRTMYYDGAYAPFGEPYAQTGTTDLSFTGMNQDTVANLYDFPAREYGTQGRWPLPDPSGISSVSLSNPQTLNRYAYVMNNPLSLADPLGLHADDCWWYGTCMSGGGGGGGGGAGGGGGNPFGGDCSWDGCSNPSPWLPQSAQNIPTAPGTPDGDPDYWPTCVSDVGTCNFDPNTPCIDSSGSVTPCNGTDYTSQYAYVNSGDSTGSPDCAAEMVAAADQGPSAMPDAQSLADGAVTGVVSYYLPGIGGSVYGGVGGFLVGVAVPSLLHWSVSGMRGQAALIGCDASQGIIDPIF
jgi:RHS repeat-associated protein